MTHETWNVIITSDECPYMAAVRKTGEPFPCRHPKNELKICVDSECPTSTILVEEDVIDEFGSVEECKEVNWGCDDCPGCIR